MESGTGESSDGQNFIPMVLCPLVTSAHRSVTELNRISFLDVYSKYWFC